MDGPLENCVNCGTPLAGEYCHACGEQRAADRDLSLRALLREAAGALLDLDARGYRTLRALVSRPGLLTSQYVSGVRKAWLSPIQLFLIANVVYFIYNSIFADTVFTTPLAFQRDGQVYSELVRRLVDARFAAADPASFRAFEQWFDAASEAYAKSLVIILAPLIAGVVALLRAGRREVFGKHLVFALHLLTVLLFLLMVLPTSLNLVQWLALRLVSPEAALALSGDVVFVYSVLVILLTYLYPAFRRAYGSSRARAALLALGLGVALLPVVHAYRLVLFLLVFYTV